MALNVKLKPFAVLTAALTAALLWAGTSAPTPKAASEARPLTQQELQNAEAFAKAMNYIRFFHPRDEAAAADWNRLASEGMRFVEGANNLPELSERLKTYFAPYAPTVQFLAPGETQKYLPHEPVTQENFNQFHQVRWSHRGIGLIPNDPRYKSEREYLPIPKKSVCPGGFFTAVEILLAA